MVTTRILCRVEVDSATWLLCSVDGNARKWECLPNEAAVQSFLARNQVTCPPRCLTPEESHRVVAGAKKKIQKLEEDIARYKALLEKALGNATGSSASGAWVSTESPSLPASGTANYANRVTTGSSGGTRTTVSSLSSVQNNVARGEKLGTYAAGLQSKFLTTLSGVKRPAGSISGTVSDHGSDTSSHRDPSPQLKRSTSSASVGTHSHSAAEQLPASLGLVKRQNSVQELKSLLKQKRADGPLDSLDPYLTDTSSAAATPSSAQARTKVPLSPAVSTALNSPASAQSSGPQLFSSDDDGDNYWTESDAGSSVYDRQRDLEGGASTDDGGYGTDGSNVRSRTETSPSDRRRVARNKTFPGSISGASDASPASSSAAAGGGVQTAAAGGGVLGIALKDESSRDSATVVSAGHPRLPRRSQSFDSLGSNSNSNSRALSSAGPSRATGDRAGADAAYASAAAPTSYAEDDSCLSMRLSQDEEEESRSMLFSQLRDDATNDTLYRGGGGGSRSFGLAGSLSGTKPAPAAGSSEPSGLFGLVMRVANYFHSPSPAAAAPTPSAPAKQYVQQEEEDQKGSDGDDDEPLDVSEDEQTLVEEEPEDVAGAEMPVEDTGADEGSAAGAVADGATAEVALPELTLSLEKVSAEVRGKLKVFEKTVRKAQLPGCIETALLWCLLTQEASPIDAAEQVSTALRAMLRAGPVAGKAAEGMSKTQGDAQSVLAQVGAVLQKLCQRNKKIVVADALTVQTICACCILHVSLLMHFYSHHAHLLTATIRATVSTTVAQTLDRLVLMLSSIFLQISDLPWLLQAGDREVIINEDDDIAHIERYVRLLRAQYSASPVWEVVRDAVLRYDYSYQRNLISPVKAARPSSHEANRRTNKSSKVKPAAAESKPAAAAGTEPAHLLPLFDILSCPTQPGAVILPPRGRSSSGSSASTAGNASSMPPPAAASKGTTAGQGTHGGLAARSGITGATGPTQPAQKSILAELLQKARKRKAGEEVDAAPELPAEHSAARLASTRAGDNAPPAASKRNKLLSDKPKQVGHRTSMGVGKRVVIRAKSLAANAAASAAVVASSKSTGIARSSTTGGASRGGALPGDAYLYESTPRKAISFSQGTPVSSQRDDYLLFTHGSAVTASARRHRNTTVIESTPMEALQPRRSLADSAARFSGEHGLSHHLSGRSDYMSSPSPDHSQRRRRAPSTGCSSSSGESSSQRGAHRNRLSSLFNTQDEGDNAEEGEGEGGPAVLGGATSLLAQAAARSSRSFLHDESFHYLPDDEMEEEG